MPVIGAGVGIPGTSVGVSARVGGQTPSEKEADTATRVSENAERDRVSDTATRPETRSQLDQLVATDALQRFR